ncbi:ras GTPase-activating-like protein IQGAP1 isoform X2 [Bacillus rossius redtenbacheri]|uniref:ras GTPase-activating-like protein IQGAP1 isoform X2 n=1 Tax=Bacillus rossius redtenbacheri TaxID=93214 RepID=UPI002FDE546E
MACSYTVGTPVVRISNGTSDDRLLKNKCNENLEPRYGSLQDPRHSGEEMDEIRQKNLAYEYLCHLEEAKIWLEAVLKEQLPPPTELEESLRNGVYLAKLGHLVAPETVPLSKIFDTEQKRYRVAGLQFRHTDNINYWLKSLESVELPLTFHPETTDVYEKKNMPRVIYCIHALSTHLFKLGQAPLIQDLYGKVDFTDEQISAVSQELRKCGQQMPSFQKIGGILSRGASGDEGALHAAARAINDAVDKQDSEQLRAALRSPAAVLQHVQEELASCYLDVLAQARADKVQVAANKSLSDSFIPDVYDELLTLAEIQGHITSVNVTAAWCDAVDAVQKRDEAALCRVLASPALLLKDVQSGNAPCYLEEFGSATGEPCSELVTGEQREKLQAVVCRGNYVARNQHVCGEALAKVNAALREGSSQDLLAALGDPVLRLPGVSEFAAPLYLEEMRVDRLDLGKDLVLSDVESAVRVLNSVAAITRAVDVGSPDLTWEALCNPALYFVELDEAFRVKYYLGLKAVRDDKVAGGCACPLLTYLDVQECIDTVNQLFEDQGQLIAWLHQLSAAVRQGDPGACLSALTDPPSKLAGHVTRDNIPLYLQLLKCKLEGKPEGAELWLEDLEAVAGEAAEETRSVEAVARSLAAMDRALTRDDARLLEQSLREMSVAAPVSQRVSARLFHTLKECRRRKEGKYSCDWVCHHTRRGVAAFVDVRSGKYQWEKPREFLSGSRFLGVKDVKSVLGYVTAVCENKAAEKAVVRLQACARGLLARRRLAARREHFQRNIRSIVKIQAWWRGVRDRRLYQKCLEEREKEKGKTIESCNYNMDWYQRQERKVVKVQALWRGRRTRRVFRSLLRHPRPSLPVVRHFVHLLECTPHDYQCDLQLQALRGEVVQAIRHNQELARQLDAMDIKIGLLVHNRITLQDVVAHGTTLNDLARQGQGGRASLGPDVSVKGLKSLTREGRRKLDHYQQLFYLLQTSPAYFSRLIVCLPQGYFSKYLQDAIFALFNYGANQRGQYLFLKLLEGALHEEVRYKFEKLSDVMSGNSMVLKLATNYTRQNAAQNSLRSMLGPLVEHVLGNRSLIIETNPVEIYKFWRNGIEMETGRVSELPEKVTTNEALAHAEVRARLARSLEALRANTLMFLDRITESLHLIPYGMLFVSRVLKEALQLKFDQCQEKDILKVVGNLIYYQYINSAIVAPDAYDIVDVTMDNSLDMAQRRNLASIAKILQFAATKKGYGEECHYLTCLNPFIVECHERFKQFFRRCCAVEGLDEYFHMHEFTEAMLISQPTAELSLQEICNIHKLLLQYQDQIAPDPMDPLCELLEDLGPDPSVAALLDRPESDPALQFLGRTVVCLTLVNRHQLPASDDTDVNQLFIRAKELLVSVLPCLHGSTLPEALGQSETEAQQRTFEQLLSRRARLYEQGQAGRFTSLGLWESKQRLRTMLQRLELEGLVSRDDGYQQLLSAVAQDICKNGHYRDARRREMETLRDAKRGLQLKGSFYQEQVAFYNQYLQRCLENMNAGKRQVHSLRRPGRMKSRPTLKYSAAKLHEKGVLLEVQGLPTSQLKNVQFEIAPTDSNGVFTVTGKFMGVQMEKVELDIQDLLQLQFEGATNMDMFGKARINVNLLLFLLNSKFYGKA